MTGERLSNKEKELVGKVFGGLTLLDTMQSETGVQALRADIRTPHEEAVFNNINSWNLSTLNLILLFSQP